MADDARQHVDATQHRCRPLHGLEVDGQRVRCQIVHAEEELDQAGRPHRSPAHHGKRDHRLVALEVLPHQEDDERAPRAAEEPNHRRTIPGVLIPTVVECEAKLNRRGAEQGETDQIKLGRDGLKGLKDGELSRSDGVGDVNGDEQDGHKGTNGEVDVEACSTIGAVSMCIHAGHMWTTCYVCVKTYTIAKSCTL